MERVPTIPRRVVTGHDARGISVFVNHGLMNHGPMNHGPMNHGPMDHGPMHAPGASPGGD
jgi:hypothetical protein